MNTWRELIEGRHALSTGVVVLSIAVPALNAFITSTVLPTAVAEIGGLSIYAWGSTAYAVTSIVGSAGSSVVTRKVGTRPSPSAPRCRASWPTPPGSPSAPRDR